MDIKGKQKFVNYPDYSDSVGIKVSYVKKRETLYFSGWF